MQPMQWIRNVTPQVQAELSTEDAAAATYELILLSRDFDNPSRNYFNILKTVDRLLKRGANPNAVYKYPGMPESKLPVISMAIPDHPAVVDLLLQAGADPDSHSHSSSVIKDSILFKAIEKDNERIVANLLRHGANPNFVNELERTPLILAVEKGNPKIVTLLLQVGADPNGGRETFRQLQAFSQLRNTPERKLLSLKELMNLNPPPALTLARTKLAATQNETDKQHYRDIIEMLERPETIKHIGLQKLP